VELPADSAGSRGAMTGSGSVYFVQNPSTRARAGTSW
jgi:hypothetical protein